MPAQAINLIEKIIELIVNSIYERRHMFFTAKFGNKVSNFSSPGKSKALFSEPRRFITLLRRPSIELEISLTRMKKKFIMNVHRYFSTQNLTT